MNSNNNNNNKNNNNNGNSNADTVTVYEAFRRNVRMAREADSRGGTQHVDGQFARRFEQPVRR